MTITSPCINVCVTDPDTDLCYGCSRTSKEIKEWSKYNDEEQLKVVEISRTEWMDGNVKHLIKHIKKKLILEQAL